MAEEAFQKLKQDAIALFIGILLGLPAWGIMIAQLFSVISIANTFEISSLFKLFTILYFTLPFFVIFALVIFQLRDQLVRRMRKQMIELMTGILLLSFTVLFFHTQDDSTKGDLRDFIIVLVSIFVCLLLCRYILGFIEAIDAFHKKWMAEKEPVTHNISLAEKNKQQKSSPWLIRLLNCNRIITKVIDHIFYRTNPKNDNSNISDIKGSSEEDIKKKQGSALINFSIFFLFIPIQWIISLLITVNHDLYNSLIFIVLAGLTYYLPYAIYRYWKIKYIELGLEEKTFTSNTFIPNTLVILPTILFVVLFFTGYSNQSKDINLIEREHTYFNHFKAARQLKTSIIPELQLIQLIKRNDSIRIHIGNHIKKQNLKISDGNWMLRQLQSEVVPVDKYSNSLLAHFYDSLVNTAHSSIDTIEQIINDYDLNLRILAASEMKAAIQGLKQTSREVQIKGLMIFTTTFLILAYILLMLFFKDDKYGFSASEEIPRIRKIAGTVALLIAILLYPLVNIIDESKIKPQEPWSIFLLGNWHLIDNEANNRTGLDPDRNTLPCNCCPTIINQYFDSAHRKVYDSVKVHIEGANELTVAIKLLLDTLKAIIVHDTAGDFAKNNLLSEIRNNTAKIANQLSQLPYPVTIKDPLPKHLDTLHAYFKDIYDLLDDNRKSFPKKRNVDSATEAVEKVKAQLDEYLRQQNKKRSPVNRKTDRQ